MQAKYKLIYNPFSGSKRRLFSRNAVVSLEDIKILFDQYQIPADFVPTEYKNHAKILGKEAVKEGYDTVLVAGGDGTVGEVANGLINSDVTLGILPLGSFMNVARMLSIPNDLEKAVELIKIRRTRKIDVGQIMQLDGEKLSEPYYFLESAGVGLQAQLTQHFVEIEKGDYTGIAKMIGSVFEYYNHPAHIKLDGEEIKTRATLVTVSNGPYSGAAFNMAPTAKLNDHRLTVSFFYMSKFEIFRYFYDPFKNEQLFARKIKVYQAKKVEIVTKTKRLLHADARKFGTTPAQFTIVPNALHVIAGFPKDASSLLKRTYLDP